MGTRKAETTMKRHAIEGLVSRLINLAKDVRKTGVCLDLLTYLFASRAFELELVKALKASRLEDVWEVMNARRGMDAAIVNAVRSLYPILLKLESDVGETVLRVIHRLDDIQLEIDDFILKAAKSGKAEIAYQRLLEELLRNSLDTKSYLDANNQAIKQYLTCPAVGKGGIHSASLKGSQRQSLC